MGAAVGLLGDSELLAITITVAYVTQKALRGVAAPSRNAFNGLSTHRRQWVRGLRIACPYALPVW